MKASAFWGPQLSGSFFLHTCGTWVGMTPGLDSAPTCRLFMWLELLRAWWLASTREASTRQRGDCVDLYHPASEVGQHRFCQLLLVRATARLPRFKRIGHRPHLLIEGIRMYGQFKKNTHKLFSPCYIMALIQQKIK